MALLLAVRRIEGGRPCCCHDDLMKSKRRGRRGEGGVHDQNKCQRPRDRLRGVTWRYVGRSHVSPEGSDLPTRRSFRARLIETWGQGHGWKTLPLLSLTYANSLRDFENRGTTSATIAPLSSCYEFSWGETRDFLNKIFFSILKRDSISKLIMYRSFNILFG